MSLQVTKTLRPRCPLGKQVGAVSNYIIYIPRYPIHFSTDQQKHRPIGATGYILTMGVEREAIMGEGTSPWAERGYFTAPER